MRASTGTRCVGPRPHGALTVCDPLGFGVACLTPHARPGFGPRVAYVKCGSIAKAAPPSPVPSRPRLPAIALSHTTIRLTHLGLGLG